MNNITLSNQQKRLLIIMMTAMIFLGMAATDIYLPALPQMVTDFNTTPGIINLTLSCYTLGIAVSVLFVGELSNRFGRRKLLIAALSNFTLTSWVIAMVHSIWLIILCRVIQSIGMAIILTVTRLALKDYLNPKEQLNANGILLTGLIVSPAIAPIIGAYLIIHYKWTAIFKLVGTLSLLLTVLLYTFIPETNPHRLNKLHKLSYYLKIYFLLLRNRNFLCMVLISSCTTSAYFAFIGISSYLFISHWNFTPQQYSWLFLLTAAAYMIGNFGMRFLNHNNLSLDKIIRLGVGITLIGMFIFSLSAIAHIPAIPLITGAIIMRSANALINPTTQVKVINRFHYYSAQANGLGLCVGFMFNSFAINSVTLFSHRPLLGLISISGILTIIGAAAYLSISAARET